MTIDEFVARQRADVLNLGPLTTETDDLEWTSRPPCVPGVYLRRRAPGAPETVVELCVYDEELLAVSLDTLTPVPKGGQWAPLEPCDHGER